MTIRTLFKAVDNNDVNRLVKGISQKNINKQNKEGLTLIHKAVICNNIEAAQIILKNGANIDIPDKNWITPMVSACSADNHKMVKLLMGYKLIITWNEPMMIAAANGCKRSLICLLELGGNVDGYLDDGQGFTPMHWAVQEGHADIVKLLAASGANLDIFNDAGMTPLYIASAEGHSEIVDFLIKAGADIEGRINQNDLDATPLIMACSWNHIDSVRILLENGADIDVKDRDGRTALFYSVLRQHKEISNLLIAHGANTDIRDYRGYTLEDLDDSCIRQKIDNEEDFFDDNAGEETYTQ